MLKQKQFLFPLLLACSLSYFYTILLRAIWVVFQSHMLKQYADTTPFAHFVLLGAILSILFTLFLPQLTKRFGFHPVLIGILILSCCFLILITQTSLKVLKYISFLGLLNLGNLIMTMTGVMVNAALDNRYRTTFQGLYSAFYNIAISIGPLVISAFGDSDLIYFCFFVGCLFFILGMHHLHTNKGLSFKSPPLPKTPQIYSLFRGLHLLKQQPSLFTFILISCINMGFTGHILVYWGDSFALDLQAAQTLPAIFALGATLLTLPISYFADHYAMHQVFKIILFALLITYSCLGGDIHFEHIDYIALMIMGGCIGALAGFANAAIGNHFKKQDLMDTTAILNIFRTLFIVLGVYISGEIVDQMGAAFFNKVMVGVNGCLFVIYLYLHHQETPSSTP